MKPSIPFHLPEDLPPKTAMALFDLLNELTDALWQHYESELVDLIVNDSDPYSDVQQRFDFDDDLTF